MTALASNYPTLIDIARATDPKGGIAQVAEILNQVNPMTDDMPMVEGNLVTGHKSTLRTALPSPTWRKMYGGVVPTKSSRVTVTDSIGNLEDYAEIDVAIANLGGNAMAFRASEDAAHIEGISQEWASKLIYGNEGLVPEAFTGFAPRFNDQASDLGSNILTSAATPDSTDNTSIYLIGWAPDKVFGIYPKGSTAGIHINDLGEVTAGDASSGYWQAYRTHYKVQTGLVVADWRYVVRIQIDAEDLVSDAETGPDLIDLMAQAIDLLPSTGNCRPIFYANRTVRGFIRRQIMNKTVGSTLSIEQLTRPNGALIREPMFDGIPIRRCDAILSNEAGI